MARLFHFPHPVNEVAARIVAGMVASLAVAVVAFDLPWLMFVLAYGFLARVTTGPRLCPMAQLALRVGVPLLGHRNRPIAGPPKRFAQGVGLSFSTAALVLFYGFGLKQPAYSVLSVLAFFALLESALNFCAGCFVFERLMRWGLVPKAVCDRCANFSEVAGQRHS